MPDDLTPFQPGYVHQDDEEGRHTFDLSCLFPNPTDSDRGVLAPTSSPGSQPLRRTKGKSWSASTSSGTASVNPHISPGQGVKTTGIDRQLCLRTENSP